MTDMNTMKSDLYAVGPDQINEALEDSTIGHILTLKTDYNVTFEDPTKPSGTAYRRVQFLEGDSFLLTGVRSTTANLIIFQFEPYGENAEARAKRWSSGPGLTQPIKVAEFTMKNINDERMNGRFFLDSILNMIRIHGANDEWQAAEANIERGELWGSW